MIIEMIKTAGGTLVPASDFEYERLKKFKTDEQYQVNIKLTRNPIFHRKVFTFFNFCFNYWNGGNEFQSESKQFDNFRKDLTILAGFYEQYTSVSGEVRVEAKSLSYASMSQDEFEQCYSALINAALTHIFKTTDENTYNNLVSFF